MASFLVLRGGYTLVRISYEARALLVLRTHDTFNAWNSKDYMVGAQGLEPRTSSLSVTLSNQLSYAPAVRGELLYLSTNEGFLARRRNPLARLSGPGGWWMGSRS